MCEKITAVVTTDAKPGGQVKVIGFAIEGNLRHVTTENLQALNAELGDKTVNIWARLDGEKPEVVITRRLRGTSKSEAGSIMRKLADAIDTHLHLNTFVYAGN